MLAAGGAERLRGLIAEAMALPSSTSDAALDDADLSSPAGRDRALDEVAPVLAAMGESISRDELARLVADRLDADPALGDRGGREAQRGVRRRGRRRGGGARRAAAGAAAPSGAADR